MPCFNILSGVLKKKDFSSRKYEDFILIAIFADISLNVKHLGYECFRASFFPPIPNAHLRDNYFTAIAPVLGHHSKQAS